MQFTFLFNWFFLKKSNRLFGFTNHYFFPYFNVFPYELIVLSLLSKNMLYFMDILMNFSKSNRVFGYNLSNLINILLQKIYVFMKIRYFIKSNRLFGFKGTTLFHIGIFSWIDIITSYPYEYVIFDEDWHISSKKTNYSVTWVSNLTIS